VRAAGEDLEEGEGVAGVLIEEERVDTHKDGNLQDSLHLKCGSCKIVSLRRPEPSIQEPTERTKLLPC
jgi:hypothetical protein